MAENLPVIPLDGGGGGGGLWDKFTNLTSDRNFQALLAGMGTQFGRGGAGEMIGKPALQMIQGLAAQEAAGKGEDKRTAFNKQLFDLLAGLSPKDMTPAEQAGVTGLKQTGKGMTLDFTPETPENRGQPGVGGAGEISGVGAGPKLSDAIRF